MVEAGRWPWRKRGGGGHVGLVTLCECACYMCKRVAVRRRQCVGTGEIRCRFAVRARGSVTRDRACLPGAGLGVDGV